MRILCVRLSTIGGSREAVLNMRRGYERLRTIVWRFPNPDCRS